MGIIVLVLIFVLLGLEIGIMISDFLMMMRCNMDITELFVRFWEIVLLILIIIIILCII